MEISKAWRYRRPKGDVNSDKEVPKARRRSREKRADLKVKLKVLKTERRSQR